MKKSFLTSFFLLFVVVFLPFFVWALSALWQSHERLVDKSVQSAMQTLRAILRRDLQAMLMVTKAQGKLEDEGA